MPDILGEEIVRIRSDTTGFESQTRSSVLGSATRLAASLGGVFAAVKVFDFAKGAVEESAQTQKAIENVKAQFGPLSDGVLKFGESAGQSFGISDQASLQFASTLALTGKNIGLTQSQTAKMSTGFQELAGSIGNIKGIDPASVFDKLSLAMLGNTRGLKSLGISADSLAQKQEALKLGIDGTSSSWTSAQKAQIIYGIATKNLGGFMDQAKKHSGDLVDIQRRLSAEWANAKEQLGAALLPVLERFGGFLAANLPTALAAAGAASHFLGTEIGALVTFIGPVTGAIHDLILEFVGLLNQGYSLSTALKAVGESILVDFGVSLGTARSIMGDLVSAIDLVRAAFDVIVGFIQAHTEVFIALAAGIGITTLAIYGIATAMVIGTAVSTAFGAALAFAFAPLTIVIVTIGLLVAAIIYLYRNNQTAHDIIVAVWGAIRSAVTTALTFVRGVITGFVSFAEEIWRRWGDTIKTVVQTVWGLVKGIVQTDLAIIRGVINIFAGLVTGDWSRMWNGIKQVASAAVGALGSIARGIGPLILKAIEAIPGLLTGLNRLLYQAGIAIIQGLINGIESMAGAVVSKVKSIASSAVGAVTGALGIGSPSKVFHDQVGVPIVQGIIAGLTTATPDLLAAATLLAQHTTAAASVGGSLGGVSGRVTARQAPVGASPLNPLVATPALAGVHVETLVVPTPHPEDVVANILNAAAEATR